MSSYKFAMNKETILREIQRLAAANGGVAPGRLALESATGIRESAWRGVYWARWNDAVKEAGCAPNKVNAAYPKEHLLGALAQLTREIGHIPSYPELRLRKRTDTTFPNDRTFSRLGTKAEQIAQLFVFCRERVSFSDVALICEKALATKADPADEIAPSEDSDEFVYMLKSGRHYKIGRSNDPDRRDRELALQTVEKNVRIHSIRTDDPSGIETYWHRRFADKRVRADGEWFALSARDVAAFRRRKKFM